MAVIGSNDLVRLRQEVAGEVDVVNYTKAQLNAAIQAVEDFFEGNRQALSGAINASTAPVVLTGQQKTLLVKRWMRNKFDRGG